MSDAFFCVVKLYKLVILLLPLCGKCSHTFSMLRFPPLRAPKNSSISTTSHYCLLILVLPLCGKCSHTISNMYIRHCEELYPQTFGVVIWMYAIQWQSTFYLLRSQKRLAFIRATSLYIAFLNISGCPICPTPRAPKQISLLNL